MKRSFIFILIFLLTSIVFSLILRAWEIEHAQLYILIVTYAIYSEVKDGIK